MPARTVTTKLVPNYPALNMKMGETVRNADIQHAYMEIERHLDNFDHPIFVIVDLTENIYLPVSATLYGALIGPYAHPKIKQWLVIGNHPTGRVIAQQLKRWTGKNHVVWFDTCEECLVYIEQEMPQYVETR